MSLFNETLAVALTTRSLTFTSADCVSEKKEKCKPNLTYNVKPSSLFWFFLLLERQSSDKAASATTFSSRDSSEPCILLCKTPLFQNCFSCVCWNCRDCGNSFHLHCESAECWCTPQHWKTLGRKSVSLKYRGDLECVSQCHVCCFFWVFFAFFNFLTNLDVLLSQLSAKLSCRAPKQCLKFNVLVPIQLDFKFREIFIDGGCRIHSMFVDQQENFTFQDLTANITWNWWKLLVPRPIWVGRMNENYFWKCLQAACRFFCYYL